MESLLRLTRQVSAALSAAWRRTAGVIVRWMDGTEPGACALAMAEPFDLEKSRLQSILGKPLGKLTVGWIVGLIAIGAIGLVTIVGVRPRSNDPKLSATKANIMSLAKVLQRYARDHGGRLPIGIGQRWVSECKGYIQSTPVLFSPYDSRHESATDYQLTNVSAGQRLDTLQPGTVLLIDTASGDTPVCLLADLTFHKVTSLAVSELLFQSSAHSGSGLAAQIFAAAPLPPVGPGGFALDNVRTESACIYPDPPRWSRDGITATLRGIARVKKTGPGGGERLAVYVEAYSPTKDWSNSPDQTKLLDASGRRLVQNISESSVSSDGSFTHLFLFPLPAKGAKSLKELSIPMLYHPQSGGRTRSGPYPMIALSRPVAVADGDMVLAMADWAVDQRPIGYLELLERGPGFFRDLNRHGYYLSVRVYLSPTGDGWRSLTGVVMRGADGRQALLSPISTEANIGPLPPGSRSLGWPGRSPYLGMELANPVEREQSGGGVAVTAVDPNAPAWKAGIRPGDEILTIGKTPYPTDDGGMTPAAGPCRAGAPVAVGISRNGKRSILTVTPIDDPLLGDISSQARTAWNRLITSNLSIKSPYLKLVCLLSREPVPADFRPSSVEFWFDKTSAGGSTGRTEETAITFRNIPIPAEFWASPSAR